MNTDITDKQLVAWAEGLHKKYAKGNLLSFQIAAMEALPGWSWVVTPSGTASTRR